MEGGGLGVRGGDCYQAIEEEGKGDISSSVTCMTLHLGRRAWIPA